MHASTSADPTYGYTVHLRDVPFDEARRRVVDALKGGGFGILTEIDVKSTLKAKLDRDFRRYVSIARPEALFELVNRQDVQPVAQEADQRLRRALEQVSSGA
jgi:hypothetical protein